MTAAARVDSGRGSGAPKRRGVEIPRYSPRLLSGFARYLRRYFGRNFTAVRVSKASSPTPSWERPVIFYSNHPSWWDPIFYMLLAHDHLRVREGYGPMDAAMLEKYAIFRRLGIFGVEAGTRRGAATFLRTSLAVLERPGATLWLTAEGEFTDPRRRPLALRPGLAHLAARLERALIVPLALEYPFWNERRPEALARFGEPLEVGERRLSIDEWSDLLTARLEATMDGLAEESARRDADAFVPLVAGRTGVGGVYDLGRRIKALWRGERFHPGHGEDET